LNRPDHRATNIGQRPSGNEHRPSGNEEITTFRYFFPALPLYLCINMEMGIEKDINQAKFRNEHQKATINILYTYGWLMERTKELFSIEDITPQQYNILRILRGSAPEPLSTLQIRERMLDKMSDTSRIVDRLVGKGLVKKGTCKKDRRLVDITITEKGKKLLERLDVKQDDLDSIVSGITKKEASQLSDLLDKIRNGGE